MRTLYESLLDDEDVLMAKSDENVAIVTVEKWIENFPTSYNKLCDKPKLVNGKVEWNGLLCIGNNYNLDMIFPAVEFRKVGDISICDQKMLDKFKDCLPKECGNFLIKHDIPSIDLKNLKVQAEFIDIRNCGTIKNVEFIVPEKRSGLYTNKFEIRMSRLRHIKEVKIDGINNIVVSGIDNEIGDFMCNQVKYEVKKYKKKTPFTSRSELDKFIMEIIYKHLPWDHIEKHWKGVTRIVFKDRSHTFTTGFGLGYAVSTTCHSGDFFIEKRQGEWAPYHKLFRDFK